MRSRLALLCALLAFALTIVLAIRLLREPEVPIALHAGDARDPLPPGWNANEVLPGIRWVIKREGQRSTLARSERRIAQVDAEVLAWSRQRDDRPLREIYEGALVHFHVRTAGRPRWIVAWLTRYPQTSGAWRPCYVTDMEWRPFRSYDHPPGNAEIDRFVDGAAPSMAFFGPFGPDFRVLASSVREQTWRAAVGEPPTRSFVTPPEAEREEKRRTPNVATAPG